MMRTLLAILLITIQSLHAQTNSVKGTWKGDLIFGERKIDIILEFELKNNILTGKLSSQKQQLKDIGISNIQLKQDSLSFEVPLAGGAWKGKLNNPEHLIGTWSQGPYKVSLNFEKQDKEMRIEIENRKQTPKAPFSYLQEEVSYLNKRDGTKLAATLTIPKGKGPFPAAILLTVAGPNDRDQTHGNPQHKPYLVLADYLTKHGIAVLRADDRGVGGSNGNVFESTIEDFAHDALAGFDYLLDRSEIDNSQIGFIGNSEGTLVGPLAASINNRTAFIVVLGGIGISGAEVLLDQADAIGRIAKLSDLQIEKLKKRTNQLFEILRQEPDNEKVRKKLIDILKKDENEQHYNAEFLMPQSAEEQAKLFATNWYRYQVNYDPAPILQKTTIPFLAIHGDIDPFVNADKNLRAFTKHLTIAQNRQFAVVKLKGLNHVFQDATSGSPLAYNTNEVSFSPRALKLIGTWLKTVLY